MNKKNNHPFADEVAIQSWLCPALTPVPANVDYTRFKEILDDISGILRKGGLEAQAIDLALERFESADAAARAPLCHKSGHPHQMKQKA